MKSISNSSSNSNTINAAFDKETKNKLREIKCANCKHTYTLQPCTFHFQFDFGMTPTTAVAARSNYITNLTGKNENKNNDLPITGQNVYFINTVIKSIICSELFAM